MNKKVLISIDHKWRDLPGHVLLGKYLSELGFIINYCRNGLEKYYLAHENYDVVIINHIFETSRQRLIQKYSQLGVKFIILPTEGIPTLEDFTDFALGVDLDYSGVALYAFWNSHYTQRFILNETLGKSKIVTVGVPRFDFYKKPFVDKISNFEIVLDNSYKKILWATNFNQAQFHCPKKFALMQADASRLGYKKTLEKMQGSLEEVAAKDFFARDKSLQIMMQYLKDHKNAYLILKPHPSEDSIYYQEFIKHYGLLNNRVSIVKNEYIWDLLKWCDVEVSRSCTTAAEAWHLEKPTIDLNPDRSWYHSDKHAKGSYECNDYQELKKAMKFSLTNGWMPTNDMMIARKKFINTYCEGYNGDRTKKLADVIFNLVKDNTKVKYQTSINFVTLLIYLMLKYFDGLPHNLKIYGASYFVGKRVDQFGRSDKNFHKKDLMKWNKILRKVL
jgi:surface carbohydrate biosynthesis protein